MIDRADISGVLSQMRALRAEAQQGIRQIEMPEVNQVKPQQEVQKTDFTELLRSAVDSVSDQQALAKTMVTAYERGEPGVDLAEVMIQAQKASVSFTALTQVRNRLVTAYEDIMKMPI
ncbi:MAG: flagellar hook-basal body complex protein FliE [Oceanospirillaceae bacterium]|nr:flagellar hook-basal body complex protein FliE [Oceanospirillaceae bacterium]